MLIRRPNLAMLACLVAALLTFADAVGASEPTVAVSLEPVEETYFAGGPVPLLLRIDNNVPEPVTLDLGLDYVQHLAFRVRLPDGSTIESTAPSSATTEGDEGVFAIGREEIEGGGSFELRLLLNKWLSLETPGSYSIEIRITEALLTASSQRIEPPAASLEVTLTDDPAALARRCRQLLEQARSGGGRATRTAAETLSWSRHPACLPALEGLVDSRFTGLAIQGLEAVGGASAARSLLGALERVDCLSAIRIRQALTRLQGQLDGSELAERVDRVLADAPEQTSQCLESLGLAGESRTRKDNR